MTKYLSIASVLVLSTMLAFLATLAIPARPQTTTTRLVMTAHWDDGSIIGGNADFASVNASGQDSVIATEMLTNGRAAMSAQLAPNSLYDVTLTTSGGARLAKFPLTTALINPQNLQRGEVDLVFRKADNSLKSAKVSVSLGF